MGAGFRSFKGVFIPSRYNRLAALCGRDSHGIPGFPWKEISTEAAYVESPICAGNGHGQGTPQRYAYIPCLRVEYVETGI